MERASGGSAVAKLSLEFIEIHDECERDREERRAEKDTGEDSHLPPLPPPRCRRVDDVLASRRVF